MTWRALLPGHRVTSRRVLPISFQIAPDWGLPFLQFLDFLPLLLSWAGRLTLNCCICREFPGCQKRRPCW